MPSSAPCTAFRPLLSAADLARRNRYDAFCSSPMGRLESWLDQLAYDQMCRTAWGIPVKVRQDVGDLTGNKQKA